MSARVLVIGAGPAGLAAGCHLLEQGKGRVEVKLIHMGHHLGGKAGGHRDEKGRFIEHGWHMVVGFYDRMRALMKRAGIDEREALMSLRNESHPYEPRDGRLHHFSGGGSRVEFAGRFAFGYTGLAAEDKPGFSHFFSNAYATAWSGEDLTRHDDICFNTWAIERGLRPHMTKYSLFRFTREAYFNFPEQISAYHVLQSMKFIDDSHGAEQFVATGPYSEVIWQPIADYFERLGGVRTPYMMATDWVWNGRTITGVRCVRPDSRGHHEGTTSWTTEEVPPAPQTEQVLSDFDYVISTIPHAVFVKMNRSDARMWSSAYFSRLLNLRSATTVSMLLWLKKKNVLAKYRGPIFGFPAPLGIVVNMTPYWKEYRDHPEVGTVLEFVGQEAGFERWTDQQIIDFTIDNFSRCADIGDLRAAGVVDVELHRNKSDFERLLLCDPGTNQFRPGPKTPFRNLFLAGDWVRNEVDLVCMEGAIVSGENAAKLVLEQVA